MEKSMQDVLSENMSLLMKEGGEEELQNKLGKKQLEIIDNLWNDEFFKGDPLRISELAVQFFINNLQLIKEIGFTREMMVDTLQQTNKKILDYYED